MTDCGTDVIFEDESAIGVFESSEWAERGFCKSCGTALFYRLRGDLKMEAGDWRGAIETHRVLWGFFPDNVVNGGPGGAKPWNNESPNAMGDFLRTVGGGFRYGTLK